MPSWLFFFFGGIGVWTQGFALAKQALYYLSHTFSPFCSGYFGDGVSWAICLGCSLLISSSQVARITGMSHWCLVASLSWSWSWFLSLSLSLALHIHVLTISGCSAFTIDPLPHWSHSGAPQWHCLPGFYTCSITGLFPFSFSHLTSPWNCPCSTLWPNWRFQIYVRSHQYDPSDEQPLPIHCLGWLWTMILLISASLVARITGVSHHCLALACMFLNFTIYPPSWEGEKTQEGRSFHLVVPQGLSSGRCLEVQI
jgi:hypothetical protein